MRPKRSGVAGRDLGRCGWVGVVRLLWRCGVVWVGVVWVVGRGGWVGVVWVGVVGRGARGCVELRGEWVGLRGDCQVLELRGDVLGGFCGEWIWRESRRVSRSNWKELRGDMGGWKGDGGGVVERGSGGGGVLYTILAGLSSPGKITKDSSNSSESKSIFSSSFSSGTTFKRPLTASSFHSFLLSSILKLIYKKNKIK